MRVHGHGPRTLLSGPGRFAIVQFAARNLGDRLSRRIERHRPRVRGTPGYHLQPAHTLRVRPREARVRTARNARLPHIWKPWHTSRAIRPETWALTSSRLLGRERYDARLPCQALSPSQQ